MSVIMQEKFNEATPNRPQGERPIDSPLLLINLPALTKQIKEEEAWIKNDRNAITVFKTTGMNIVLIALHAHAELKTHTAPGTISVQVLDGTIKFDTPDESLEIKKGQLLTLHAGVSHSVLAVEESVFLLTMAK
ncbi:MAG: cupin domain-containing protein [Chitinophagaceae bacterium]